jgi:hypothetical protein
MGQVESVRENLGVIIQVKEFSIQCLLVLDTLCTTQQKMTVCRGCVAPLLQISFCDLQSSWEDISNSLLNGLDAVQIGGTKKEEAKSQIPGPMATKHNRCLHLVVL